MWARKLDLGALEQCSSLTWLGIGLVRIPLHDRVRNKGAKKKFLSELRGGRAGANESSKCDEMMFSCRENTNTGSPDEVVCIEGTRMVEGFGEGPRLWRGRPRPNLWRRGGEPEEAGSVEQET